MYQFYSREHFMPQSCAGKAEVVVSRILVVPKSAFVAESLCLGSGEWQQGADDVVTLTGNASQSGDSASPHRMKQNRLCLIVGSMGRCDEVGLGTKCGLPQKLIPGVAPRFFQSYPQVPRDHRHPRMPDQERNVQGLSVSVGKFGLGVGFGSHPVVKVSSDHIYA
jgi:hypothetical protein